MASVSENKASFKDSSGGSLYLLSLITQEGLVHMNENVDIEYQGESYSRFGWAYKSCNVAYLLTNDGTIEPIHCMTGKLLVIRFQ